MSHLVVKCGEQGAAAQEAPCPEQTMTLPIHHVVASGPRPVAPFSHAVEADGFVFVTGQMPTDPAAPDAPLPAGIEAQTRRVIDNLKIVLGDIGLGLEHGVMARIYLTQFERDYAALNALWPSFFEAG